MTNLILAIIWVILAILLFFQLGVAFTRTTKRLDKVEKQIEALGYQLMHLESLVNVENEKLTNEIISLRKQKYPKK